MSFPVRFMGLSLKNPILVASGPWSRDGASIQRSIDAGAAAVCTETITLEAHERICPRIFVEEDRLLNTTLYSNLLIEQWESELETVKKGDSKLICSIWGSSASELAYLASRVERMGADAIEISISAPIGCRNQHIASHTPDIEAFVGAVVKTVHIPVMVKLSYEAAASPDFLRSIQSAGVAAVSAIDALRGLCGVDIEMQRTKMETFGGYSGDCIRPASLAATAAIRQYSPLEICSTGGISSAKNALEFLMLGATCVQLASVIQLHGYQVITDVLNDLETWMRGHGYSDIEEIRGAALAGLHPYEDINPRPLRASMTEDCCDACSLCADSCLYHAISRAPDGRIVLTPSNCSGCGLCAERCPKQLFRLVWY